MKLPRGGNSLELMRTKLYLLIWKGNINLSKFLWRHSVNETILLQQIGMPTCRWPNDSLYKYTYTRSTWLLSSDSRPLALPAGSYWSRFTSPHFLSNLPVFIPGGMGSLKELYNIIQQMFSILFCIWVIYAGLIYVILGHLQ